MNVQPHLLNLSAYINQNLEKDLPLSILAKRVGLSPFHFHRKFGAYFGESLHQHIKRLRLERAAYALVNSATPVRQIARDSGYKTVSAFSHAFSGFAGESPTRYRSIGTAQRAQQPNGIDVDGPTWVGDMQPLEFAFVRAIGNGHGAQGSIRDAIDLITSRIGPIGDAGDEKLPFIAATSDFYGVSKGTGYRMDVGLEAAAVPAEHQNTLGVQTIPGGRYACFEFNCAPADLIEHCLRALTHGLNGSRETPRLSQTFLRFGLDAAAARDSEAPSDYRLYVPVAD